MSPVNTFKGIIKRFPISSLLLKLEVIVHCSLFIEMTIAKPKTCGIVAAGHPKTAVAGMFAVHRQLGRLPFKVIAKPAIAYARQGVKDSRRIYQENIAAEFLSAGHVGQYRDRFQGILNKWGSTTHVSVLDEEGNAATATTSNGEGSSLCDSGNGHHAQ